MRWPEENNPFAGFNLPPDYNRMVERFPDTARKARINAVTHQDTPEDVVRAWSFFRYHYLTGEAGFYKRPLPSPPIHARWIHDMVQHSRNIFGAPRGFAKSVVVGTEFPLFQALTRPGISILTAASEHGKAKKRGQRWMSQLMQNPKILEDFGDMRGPHRRTGRLWGVQVMQLVNTSTLETTSVGAANLGERPDLIIWDDVDPDPQRFTGSIELAVEKLVTAMFDVFLPMLDSPGTGMTIIGTLLHFRSFLYWAMTTSDPRLKFFNRILTSVYDEKGESTWPEKFPVKLLKVMERRLGDAFGAAYLNAPRAKSSAILRRHDRRTSYDCDNIWMPGSEDVQLTRWIRPDKNWQASPTDEGWVPVRKTLGALLAESMVVILCDYARSETSRADWTAASVIAIDKTDTWWQLDIWAGRGSPADTATAIWQLAEYWRAKVIGVENVGSYGELARKMEETRSQQEKKAGWVPGVRDIKYPTGLSKAMRIGSLQWRFDEGRYVLPLRYPLDNSPRGVGWRMLLSQIDAFTMDMDVMKWDDCIDTVAMVPHLLGRATSWRSSDNVGRGERTIAERLASGERVDGRGNQLVLAATAEELVVPPPPPTTSALDLLPRTFTVLDYCDVLKRIRHQKKDPPWTLRR